MHEKSFHAEYKEPHDLVGSLIEFTERMSLKVDFLRLLSKNNQNEKVSYRL